MLKISEVDMEYNKDKVDELVLALLYLTSSTDQFATRAWKGIDWEALDRLHKKGYISDPKAKSITVELSDTGAKLAKELFYKFCDGKD
jgi:hypothetical protein